MKSGIVNSRLFITLLLCNASCLFGQQGLSFKLYQNTDLFQRVCNIPSPRQTLKETKTNFSRISLGVFLQTKKNYFHEIEFQIPEFSRPLDKFDFPLEYAIWKGDPYDQVGSSFSLRYELGKVFGNRSKSIHFLLSTGLNPYAAKLAYTPSTTSAYYYSRTYFGFILNLTPRLYVNVSRHFSIDINIPFRIFDFQKEKHREDNPILPVHGQRYTETHFRFFEPVYTLRVGIMYSLRDTKQQHVTYDQETQSTRQ